MHQIVVLLDRIGEAMLASYGNRGGLVYGRHNNIEIANIML
jgi:hypothetical protein